jgi:hypothetical protein
VRAILAGVDTGAVELALVIDVDSDPITGSVIRDGGEPQRFSGWIALAELIEGVRASDGDAKSLGWVPGAKLSRSRLT